MNDTTDKFSLDYTNLNSSKEPYSFDGKADVGHYFLSPGYGNLATGVSICTIGPRMSLGVLSDMSSMTNPQDFCDIFARKN